MKSADRTDVECPECLTPHAVVKRSEWFCNNGLIVKGINHLVCGAKGTVMPDGSLAATRYGKYPQHTLRSN